MRILFILILFLFSWNIKSQATVNYPDLSVQEKAEDIHYIDEKGLQQEASRNPEAALEEQKKLIGQQLTVITGDEDTRYTIVSGDTLKVTYKDRGELAGSLYQVNGQGEIPMPLVGDVKVAGMNRGQARAFLNERLEEYIRDPQLTVDINTSGKYYVFGSAGPGVFDLGPDLCLMDALLRAGFSESRANLASVVVMRGSKDNPQILRLNLKKMMVKGDRSDNIVIKPNDLIYVPTKFSYITDSILNKLFGYIADYYTLGGNQILKSSATRGF